MYEPEQRVSLASHFCILSLAEVCVGAVQREIAATLTEPLYYHINMTGIIHMKRLHLGGEKGKSCYYQGCCDWCKMKVLRV